MPTVNCQIDFMKSLHSFLIAIAAVLVLGSCGDSEPSKANKPVRVKVMQIGSVQVNGEHAYSGTVEEESGVSLSFSVAGTLRSVSVEEGQIVNAGQLVATVDGIDQAGAQASAHAVTGQARAALQKAQDDYNRAKRLHDEGVISDSRYVSAKTALDAARQAVNSAAALETISDKSSRDTRLVAPFSGYVTRKNVEVGQNVIPGQMVVELVHIDRVKIKISVPEEEIDKIHKGEEMLVRCSAAGSADLYGKVVEKGVSADPLSRTYDVKLLVDNQGNKLLPGMICDVYTSFTRGQMSVFVPANVIQLNPDNQMFVWVVKNGKATKRVINYVADTSQGVRVNGGLEPGDQLIVSGQQKVSEGTPCEIIK